MNMKIKSLVQQNKEMLSEFEKLLGYRFTDLRLLQKALIHSSFAFEQPQGCKNNETLEFWETLYSIWQLGIFFLSAFLK